MEFSRYIQVFIRPMKGLLSQLQESVVVIGLSILSEDRVLLSGRFFGKRVVICGVGDGSTKGEKYG